MGDVPHKRDLRGDILLKGDLVAKAGRSHPQGTHAGNPELTLRRVLKVDHTGTWLTQDLTLPPKPFRPRRIHDGSLCVILERMPVHDGR